MGVVLLNIKTTFQIVPKGGGGGGGFTMLAHGLVRDYVLRARDLPWAHTIIFASLYENPISAPAYRQLRARRALYNIQRYSVENQKGAINIQR